MQVSRRFEPATRGVSSSNANLECSCGRNTNRGAWTELLVEYFLGRTGDAGSGWHYFDLRDGAGGTVSVKQAVGERARFDVQRREFAWDQMLAEAGVAGAREPEGWQGHRDRPPQHWCDLYIFAWLTDDITLDRILDPDERKFAALPRGRAFTCRCRLFGAVT